MIIFSWFHSSLDILIGGFSKPNRIANKFLATDHIYISDHATWCIRAAGVKSSWMNIFFIFSTNLWIAVTSFFVLMTILIHLYSRYDQPKYPFFHVVFLTLKINIGLMAGYAPKKFLGRVILFLLLFYGMIVSTLFQSTTVSSMTTRYHKKQISSLKEAIERDYHFAGSNFSYTVLIHRSDKVRLGFGRSSNECDTLKYLISDF